MISLSYQIDSLENEISGRDLYLNSILNAIKGGEKSQKQKDESIADSLDKNKHIDISALTPDEINLRKEVENVSSNEVNQLFEVRILKQNFSVPIDGEVSNYSKGLVYNTSKDVSIKSVFSGKIIFATSDLHQSVIIVQHEEGLIAIYKSKFVIVKKVGSIVKNGEKIAYFKSQENNKLYLETWLNGKIVNLNLKE